MPWYVAWAPTPSNGRLGVFIAFPTLLAVGQKSTSFYRQVHWTVRCTMDTHCSLSGAVPLQPTVGVYSSRLLDPTIAKLSGAHQTVRCYSPSAPICRPFYADCPGVSPDSSVHTGQGTVHCPVRHEGAG
jgi:hypothetical protein